MSKSYRFSASQSRHIIRRVVIEAELVLQTPAHFGSGESDGTTSLLVEDPKTHRPLLPGASLAGALRHDLLRRERGFRSAEERGTLATELFGEAYDDDLGTQSRIIIDDAICDETAYLLDTRAGVKIEGASRTAKEGALYDFNVWSPGTSFKLHVELCLYREDERADNLLAALATTLHSLGTGKIPLGARKNRGYGRVGVASWRTHDYRLDTFDGLVDWVTKGGAPLEDPPENSIFQSLGVEPMGKDARELVRIEATFGLQDSMLIRAGSDVVDMAHLSVRSKNGAPQPALSGTSIAGALRARALKIANTLGIQDAKILIDDMFGRYGDENSTDQNTTEPLTASRVVVEEHPIRNGVFSLVQNRVRIDRFTGGAFDTGLFSQQPVFATEDTEIQICVELQYPAEIEENQRVDAQAGLLLLLLKDLWTSDLPLGGESSVGRGRLIGRSADICIRNEFEETNIRLDETPRSISGEDRARLSAYVETLKTMRKKGDRS